MNAVACKLKRPKNAFVLTGPSFFASKYLQLAVNSDPDSNKAVLIIPPNRGESVRVRVYFCAYVHHAQP